MIRKKSLRIFERKKNTRKNKNMERLIFHIDVNSAFLSWEAARRVQEGLPDLREIPSCIAEILNPGEALWWQNLFRRKSMV